MAGGRRSKGRRGRPVGTKKFEARKTVYLPTSTLEQLADIAREQGITLSDALRQGLDSYLTLRRDLGSRKIVVTVAPRDLEDLRRAVRNGLAPPEEIATSEAIRRYLEWLRTELKEREKVLGNV